MNSLKTLSQVTASKIILDFSSNGADISSIDAVFSRSRNFVDNSSSQSVVRIILVSSTSTVFSACLQASKKSLYLLLIPNLLWEITSAYFEPWRSITKTDTADHHSFTYRICEIFHICFRTYSYFGRMNILPKGQNIFTFDWFSLFRNTSIRTFRISSLNSLIIAYLHWHSVIQRLYSVRVVSVH